MNRRVIAVVGLASLVVAASATAQPLAEVAKAERERRASLAKPSKTWTNADLRVAPPSRPSDDAPRFDFASLLERRVEAASGPTVTVIPYDRWWPFGGPPSSLGPPVAPPRVHVPIHYGHGPIYFVGGRRGDGLWNRGGSREPRNEGRSERWRSSRSR